MTKQDQLQSEIGKHYIQPNNYGKIEDADGIGVGREQSSNSYVIMYLNLKNKHITDIKFFSNSTQDVNALGSIFTEMVKGDTLDNAIEALKLMDEKLDIAPKKQQACSRMILQAFRAAIINKENRVNGMNEEMFTIDLKESCEAINNLKEIDTDGIK